MPAFLAAGKNSGKCWGLVSGGAVTPSVQRRAQHTRHKVDSRQCCTELACTGAGAKAVLPAGGACLRPDALSLDQLRLSSLQPSPTPFFGCAVHSTAQGLSQHATWMVQFNISSDLKSGKEAMHGQC